MLLLNYDFYDVHSVLTMLRAKPKKSYNCEIIKAVFDVLVTPQTDNMIENNIMYFNSPNPSALVNIPAIIAKAINFRPRFSAHMAAKNATAKGLMSKSHTRPNKNPSTAIPIRRFSFVKLYLFSFKPNASYLFGYSIIKIEDELCHNQYSNKKNFST